jgi:hypothetical protein
MRKLLLLAMVFCFIGTAQANEMTAYLGDRAQSVGGQTCKMEETLSISVNFNSIPVQIGDAKKIMDEKILEIETIARELGIKKFEMQNTNMSVYSNGNSACNQETPNTRYNMNGGVNYNLDDASMAGELAKRIESKGYQINLNSNAYRQCQ